jgi:hypothetical protein
LNILKPGGKLIGKADSRSVRILEGGQTEAEKLFQQLTVDGRIIANPTYKGTLVKLPDRSIIGLRPASKSGGPAIDVNVPGLGIDKIHFK